MTYVLNMIHICPNIFKFQHVILTWPFAGWQSWASRELVANSSSSQNFTNLSRTTLTLNPTKNTWKWLNRNTIKFDMELKPIKKHSCKSQHYNMIFFNSVVWLKLMNCHFDLYDFKIYFIKCNWKSNDQSCSFSPVMWCVMGCEEEKNHPCPKEEKASFIHQACIIHMTNDYSIH